MSGLSRPCRPAPTKMDAEATCTIVRGGTFEYQSIPTAGFTVHGSVHWSKFDRTQLIVTDNGARPVIVRPAALYAMPTYRTSTASFAFDDSLESTFDLAVQKLAGISATRDRLRDRRHHRHTGLSNRRTALHDAEPRPLPNSWKTI
jgi:hypothetical protein